MALSYTPLYAVAGDTVELSITSATGQTAATQFELTSVPSRSVLDTGLLVDANGDPVQEFIPDVSGAYAVRAYDYRRIAGGAAYPGDPAGEAREELVAVQTGTVYVGEAFVLPIRALGHAVDLRIVVVGATVAEASLVNPTTDRARLAALDSTILAALAAIEGVDVGLVGEDLQADVESLRDKFEDHGKVGGSTHNPIDNINPPLIERTQSTRGNIQLLNEIYDALLLHLGNVGGSFHDNIDNVNLPIVAKAHDRASATVLLADLRRRVYSRHIATVGSPAVHSAADTTNTITADSTLSAAIVAVLDYFAAQTPATPTGESPGAAGASEYGFTPEN